MTVLLGLLCLLFAGCGGASSSGTAAALDDQPRTLAPEALRLALGSMEQAGLDVASGKWKLYSIRNQDSGAGSSLAGWRALGGGDQEATGAKTAYVVGQGARVWLVEFCRQGTAAVRPAYPGDKEESLESMMVVVQGRKASEPHAQIYGIGGSKRYPVPGPLKDAWVDAIDKAVRLAATCPRFDSAFGYYLYPLKRSETPAQRWAVWCTDAEGRMLTRSQGESEWRFQEHTDLDRLQYIAQVDVSANRSQVAWQDIK